MPAWASRRSHILVLAVQPERAASTRDRHAAYKRNFEAAGHPWRLWSLFSDRAGQTWYEGTTVARSFALLRCLTRVALLPGLVWRSKLVIVAREVLPLGPPFIEGGIARFRPMIWDVDDAVWEDRPGLFVKRVPDWLRKPCRKFERIAGMADEVWAGSEFLAGWCRPRSRSVQVIPSVLVPAPQKAGWSSTQRTVAWIGSPSTTEFLQSILPAVAAIPDPPKVIAVGGEPGLGAPSGVEVVERHWSPEVQAAALRECRVGLYPIDRTHPLAEGKCGHKAVLYMSRGIPTVITPTATNAEIVRDGREGLHADSHSDWTAAIARLLDDATLWEAMSRAGAERVRNHYSRDVWGPRIVARAEAVMASRRGGA